MTALRALIAAILIGVAAISPARAADAYRYWSYWQLESGSWEYAKVGPAMRKATDGAVDGWRYGIGTVQTSTPPDLDIDFKAICGGTTAGPDQVRVAVVIDYGSEPDAPAARTSCAVISKGLTHASVLAAVAPLRLNQGFVCGIDGYPRSGCGEAVASPATPTPSASRTTPTATTTPSTTVATPATTPATATPQSPTAATAGIDATETAAPITTAVPTSESPTPERPSPLPTIVTAILAVIALLLALRNARLQKEAQHNERTPSQ